MLIRQVDDATKDEHRWRAFVQAQGFGQLVAAGRERDVPVVVPTQFLLDGDEIVLHLAKPNPLFESLAENRRCVMSLAGDWAYIPGAWKAIAEEDPQFGIPTTYYAAVQLTGEATVLTEPADVAAVLRRQLDALEPERTLVDPIEHGAKLQGICGIVIVVESVRAKFKYGGNVDPEHREAVDQKLHQRDAPGDRSAREQLKLQR